MPLEFLCHVEGKADSPDEPLRVYRRASLLSHAAITNPISRQEFTNRL